MTTDVTIFARCIGCDWAEKGPGADKAAEKHTKVTQHSTVTAAYPSTGKG